MSGFSDSCTCPNCGSDANELTESTPFSYTSIHCLNCGLMIDPVITYQTLEELNEARLENEMEELKELPEQDINII